MLCSLTLSLLYKYPLIQTVSLLFTNTLMIVYLLLKKPFKRIIDLIQQLCGELIIFSVNLSLFIIAILDERGDISHIKEPLCEVVIMSNLSVGFVMPVFMVIMATIAGFNFSRRAQLRKSRALQVIAPEIMKAGNQKVAETSCKDQVDRLPNAIFVQESIYKQDLTIHCIQELTTEKLNMERGTGLSRVNLNHKRSREEQDQDSSLAGLNLESSVVEVPNYVTRGNKQ